MKALSVSNSLSQCIVILRTQGVETGNMLIMTYAHAQRSGDTTLLYQHVGLHLLLTFDFQALNLLQYNLLRGWADYLVNNSLAPESQ